MGLTPPDLDAIRHWDGTLTSARALRLSVQTFASQMEKPKGKPTPEQALLLWLCKGYTERKPTQFLNAKEPEKAALVGPFLGDPELQDLIGPKPRLWPWNERNTIDEEDALPWLPLLGQVGCTDDDDILDFFLLMFHARRRSTWLVASAALVSLARRGSRRALQELQTIWKSAFPAGIKWTTKTKAKDSDPHDRRHVLHAICLWCAGGGEESCFEGFSLTDLFRQAVPTDSSDVSALLLAMKELLSAADTRARALQWLVEHVQEVQTDFQSEEVLREVWKTLGNESVVLPARAGLEARLGEPRWRQETSDMSNRFDALVSWLETAMVFKSSGEDELVQAMRKEAGDAAPVFELRLLGTWSGSLIEAVTHRLWLVFSPTVFATTPKTESVIAAVELVYLLKRSDIAPLPWSQLVERAVGPSVLKLGVGSVEAESAVDLAVVLAERGLAPKRLLHGLQLRRPGREIDDEARLFRLVGCQNGKLANQSAIQLERYLRRPSTQENSSTSLVTRELQLRLLWRVLQQRPEKELFSEVLKMLRPDAALKKIVGCVHTFVGELQNPKAADKVESECGSAAAQQAEQKKKLYEELSLHVLTFLGDEPGKVSAQLEFLAKHLPTVALYSTVIIGADGARNPKWWRGLHELLEHDTLGLGPWMEWLGTPISQLPQLWKEFDESATLLDEGGDTVTDAVCDDFCTASHNLAKALEPLPWPENLLLKVLLEEAAKWLEEKRKKARLSRQLSRQFRQACLVNNDDWLIGLTQQVNDKTGAENPAQDGNALRYLPDHELLELNQRFLRELRFTDANRLRTAVSGRKLSLPGPIVHLSKLFIAVAAGSILTLDFGSAWTEVLRPNNGGPFAATLALSLSLSFALIASQINVAKDRGLWLHRLWRGVVPVFLAAFAVALTASAVVLWTLSGTSVREGDNGTIAFFPQLLLWGSLSLFFGVFIGLVFEDRKITPSAPE